MVRKARTVKKSIRSAKRRTSTRSRKAVKRLYRSGKNKVVWGVCGGVAEYLNVDPTIIRLIWVLSFFFWGAGALAYILGRLVIPQSPKHGW